MKIENRFELLALHRCIMEAKFSSDPNDKDIARSPIVAKLANEVVEELAKIDGAEWQEWRKAEVHRDRLLGLVKSLKRQSLADIPQNDRAQFIQEAIAPFVATEATVRELVAQVFGEQSL